MVAAAGITKSGFFYHFRDKSDLAKGLMLRYMEHDRQVLDDISSVATMNEDPLHGFLVGLKLFAEMMGNMPEVHPGCLAGSFGYQDQFFNGEIRDFNAESMLAWRKRFRERFDLIAKSYPPREPSISRRSPTWRRRWSRARLSSVACSRRSPFCHGKFCYIGISFDPSSFPGSQCKFW